MKLLDGKATLVSGIGPGLGEELALVAAAEGARVAICARTEAKLVEAERKILAATPGAEVLRVPVDITDAAACRAFAQAIVDRFGRIDIVINSAYIAGGYELAAEADLADWRRTMETNLFGTMNMIQAVVPHLKAGGGGSIVNVNSKVARMPFETMGGYAVSKAALRMATTQLAKELGGARIRVNSVFPGWMWGPTVEEGLRPQAEAKGISIAELRAKISRALPLGDIPEDGECAKSVVALASDYFTAVTGACLDLSAGEYMPL